MEKLFEMSIDITTERAPKNADITLRKNILRQFFKLIHDYRLNIMKTGSSKEGYYEADPDFSFRGFDLSQATPECISYMIDEILPSKKFFYIESIMR